MSRIRVAVIGGGQNGEHEVSLASASGVVGALDPARYDVAMLTIGRDGHWRAAERRISLAEAVVVLQSCAVAVPMVHGPRGEDGSLAALCELAGIPYLGSGVGAGALAMDKWATKLVARSLGIATAPARLVSAASAAAVVWTHPVVVKPVAAGSSLGVTRVEHATDLPAALAAAFAHDDRVLVEDVVIGREIDVAVLATTGGGRVVSPALEIVSDWFDYDAKYGGAADFRVPAPLDAAARLLLEEAALAMYDALGCRGVARVDFFWTDDGPVLNEVNTTPGFTEHSQVPRMFAAAGLTYSALVELLVADALAAATKGGRAAVAVTA